MVNTTRSNKLTITHTHTECSLTVRIVLWTYRGSIGRGPQREGKSIHLLIQLLTQASYYPTPSGQWPATGALLPLSLVPRCVYCDMGILILCQGCSTIVKVTARTATFRSTPWIYLNHD